ncbi:hypothetical protein ACTFIW_006157 [Dictyostelium discoideum]
MPKYYCDYCDKYLTHDSPSVRKSHTVGKQHKLAVQLFYQQFEAEFTQSLIEARLKEYEESKGRLIHQPPMGIIPTPYGQMYQQQQQQQQGIPPFQGIQPPTHQQGMVLSPGMPIHKMQPHQFNNNNNNNPHQQHSFQPPHHQHHPHQHQQHQQHQHQHHHQQHNQPTIPGL